MRAILILLSGLILGAIPLASGAAPAPLPAPPPAAGAVEVSKPKVEGGPHAASAPGELGEPSALEQLPPAHPIAPGTRIEQIRQGNRVAEIWVTPAGSSRSYLIVTREPSRQQSLQDSGTGLSTPRFVRIEF